jgi:hypothetical protein
MVKLFQYNENLKNWVIIVLLFLPNNIYAQISSIKPSGTLPVLYINTIDLQEISSRDVYLDANYWLESMNCEGIESLGSESTPKKLKIKGRGNWTWTWFEKKPYRLKLESKEPLAGMKSNKNFCLLAHADDTLAFLRNTVGFELSRRIGMKWTPQQQPVELILNGD